MGLSALVGAIQGGDYINVFKLIPPLVILFIWARLLTWVDKDTQDAHLPRVALNCSFLGGLVVAFALFFLLPSFWIALPVLILLFGAEVGTYLYIRQKKVGLRDLKVQFNAWLKSFKGKKKEGKLEAGRVGIVMKGGGLIMPPESDSPQRPAYDAVQIALADPLLKEAEQIDMAPEENGLAIKYKVDGFDYRGTLIDKTVGGAAISYLKELTGLDVEDRRKPQSGTLKVTMDGKRHELALQTAGTRDGEYVRFRVDPKKRLEETIDQLGFTPRQLELVKGVVAEKDGIILLSAPRHQGLTTLLYGIIRAHDAFLTHIHTLEREPERDLEGITQNKLAPTAPPAEETKQISWLISQEPDVILASQIDAPQTAVDLIKFAKSGKRVYVGMRAASTFEALEQWRKLVGDDRLATQALKLVITGRVLRKLCMACKAAYAPDPMTLRKLGINPDKVSTLYQARTQPLRDQKGNPIPCEFCHDLRFRGRTGVFETLVVDDEVREIIGTGRSPNQVFRKQRGKYLQEEALALVENGDTSVQEVLRVLKGTESGARPSAAAAPAAQSGTRPPPMPGGRPSAARPGGSSRRPPGSGSASVRKA